MRLDVFPSPIPPRTAGFGRGPSGPLPMGSGKPLPKSAPRGVHMALSLATAETI